MRLEAEMRRIFFGCLWLSLATCGVEEGATLQITAVPKINSTCGVDAPATLVIARGIYDPRGFINTGAPLNYVLPLNLKNNLSLASGDPATSFTATNRRVDANDAQIIAFDVCWFAADGGEAAAYGSWDSGVPARFQCSSLPAGQKRTVPANGVAKAGGGILGLVVDVLDKAALQALYGSAFNPAYDSSDAGGSLDPIGTYPVGGTSYYYRPGDPSNAVRDPSWGNFPLAPQSTVVLQARAIGKLQDGSTVQSNWLVFPVDVCVGCLSDTCGPLTPGATLCGTTGNAEVTGPAVDLASSCLPAQLGGIKCLASWTGCP
jgi:hypothetical protein